MFLINKVKSVNYYNNLIFNYKLLYLSNLIKTHKFIVFLNYSQINLYKLYNDIWKDSSISFIINKKYINKLFSFDFNFLCSTFFCIFINDINIFINIIKLLKNENFFFSFEHRFSNLLNSNIIINDYNKYNNLNLFHINIFRIIYNIIFIILYFVTIIIKIIK